MVVALGTNNARIPLLWFACAIVTLGWAVAVITFALQSIAIDTKLQVAPVFKHVSVWWEDR